jgi:hypothetical protein
MFLNIFTHKITLNAKSKYLIKGLISLVSFLGRLYLSALDALSDENFKLNQTSFKYNIFLITFWAAGSS